MDLSVFKKLTQVAVVVRDRDATMKKYKEIMGLEPFVVCSTPQVPGRRFHGEETDFEVRAAVYHLENGVDLEVLEPARATLCGANSWISMARDCTMSCMMWTITTVLSPI